MRGVFLAFCALGFGCATPAPTPEQPLVTKAQPAPAQDDELPPVVLHEWTLKDRCELTEILVRHQVRLLEWSVLDQFVSDGAIKSVVSTSRDKTTPLIGPNESCASIEVVRVRSRSALTVHVAGTHIKSPAPYMALKLQRSENAGDEQRLWFEWKLNHELRMLPKMSGTILVTPGAIVLGVPAPTLRIEARKTPNGVEVVEFGLSF